MPFRLRITLIFLALLLLSIITIPLIYPVAELETVPLRQLAGPDATFAEVAGVNLHYSDSGTAPPTLLLLHGFGSSTFSWHKLEVPLSREARVIAFDRPGFGFSERPAVTTTSNPYTPEAQVALTLGLMERLNVQRAVLIGSSEGAAVAVRVALAAPERIAGLVLVGPALSSSGPPGWVRALFNTPQATRMGPVIMRQFAEDPGRELLRRSYADPERLTEADIAGYERPWQSPNWDRALWEVTKANGPTDLFPQLGALNVPTLVVTGAGDGLVPPEVSRRAANAIPDATFASLPDCGHLPQEECPQKLLGAVTPWLSNLQVSAQN